MSWRAALTVLALLCCSHPLAASAQTSPAGVVRPLRGTVYDSLAGQPLAHATVRLMGVTAFAETDAKGRFRFDSVAIGPITLAVEHPMLDSIGLYQLSARVQHDGRREHVVAVPSLATLSRAVCGRAVTGDSAIMVGTLLTMASQPAAGATVQLEWIAVLPVSERAYRPQRLAYVTQTDSLGRFAACGLPFDEPLTVAARGTGSDSLQALRLAIPAQHSRVLRQEFMLSLQPPQAMRTVGDTTAAGADTVAQRLAQPSMQASGNAASGTVRGMVQSPTGEPVANAIVYVGPLPELRTDSAGRFLAREVPVGSLQVEAFAVGRVPQARVASVRQGDTARVTLVLERITILQAVITRATPLGILLRGLAERQRSGMGYHRDSTELGRYPTMTAALGTVPGVVARMGRGGVPLILLPSPQGGQCEARLFVDGRPDSWDFAASLLPKDIAYMEVYSRRSLVPLEFSGSVGAACGVVHLITKAKVAP